MLKALAETWNPLKSNLRRFVQGSEVQPANRKDKVFSWLFKRNGIIECTSRGSLIHSLYKINLDLKNKNKGILEEYKEKIAAKEKDETIVHPESVKYNLLKYNLLHRKSKFWLNSLIQIGTINYLISGFRCGTGAEGIAFEKGAVSSAGLNE